MDAVHFRWMHCGRCATRWVQCGLTDRVATTLCWMRGDRGSGGRRPASSSLLISRIPTPLRGDHTAPKRRQKRAVSVPRSGSNTCPRSPPPSYSKPHALCQSFASFLCTILCGIAGERGRRAVYAGADDASPDTDVCQRATSNSCSYCTALVIGCWVSMVNSGKGSALVRLR